MAEDLCIRRSFDNDDVLRGSRNVPACIGHSEERAKLGVSGTLIGPVQTVADVRTDRQRWAWNGRVSVGSSHRSRHATSIADAT